MLFIKGWQTIKEQPVAQFIMTHTLEYGQFVVSLG